jgi:hypothetical protein
VADTYVEAGSEAQWDHGKCTFLDVDTAPFGVTYLKFNLGEVFQRLDRAWLEVRCSNTSSDGGTIYPVTNSSWVEGDRCGAGGTGLKWGQVDCNADNRITAADQACSSLAPDFSQPVASFGAVQAGVSSTLDVTSALQGGPGLYTLAIVNHNRDGATYRSREYSTAARRPRLILELADVPPRPVNDSCVAAKEVTATPFTDTVDTRGAGDDDADPALSCTHRGPTRSVWYHYTSPRSMIVAITTRGSDYDTSIGVFTGVCFDPVESDLTEVACEGDACDPDGGGQPSRLSFETVAGQTYHIIVNDEGASTGGMLRFQLDVKDSCIP